MLRKSFILGVIIAATTVANVNASPAERASLGDSKITQRRWKFGPQFGIALWSSKKGIFFERKLNKKLGIKSGLFYDSRTLCMLEVNGEKDNNVIARAKHISIPIIMRFYPGQGRQFCMFFGLRGRFIAGGKAVYLKGLDDEMAKLQVKANQESLRKIAKALNQRSVALNDTRKHSSKVNKVASDIALGLNYEFKFGLILGLEMDYSLTKLMACKISTLDWAFQIDLGYNIAKLIKR